MSVEIGKKESEVRLSQQGLVDNLHKCLGSKPTLMVCIEGIKSLPENRYLLISHSLVLEVHAPVVETLDSASAGRYIFW